MKKKLIKDSLKEIKNSYKRFISLLLIVLLGVGFFAGVKATSPDMRDIVDTYFDEFDVMDLEVISTIGLNSNDIDELEKINGVDKVVPTYSTDAILETEDKDYVVKIHTINNDINRVRLIDGKLPENENECVIEKKFLSNSNYEIGDIVTINPEKLQTLQGQEIQLINNTELKIVGIIESPLYISMTRPTTKLGSGEIDYYMYVPESNINKDLNIYTSAYISVKGTKELKSYSDEYWDLISNVEDKISKPEWYVLNREKNAGYLGYIQDADRIENIGKVFPIVFFVVAALISLNAMTRMVEEQRSQIGTLKALGYEKHQIAIKYIIYAVLATVIGSVFGAIIGFSIIPKVIINIYSMMYTLPEYKLEFQWNYAILGFALAMLCTVGATIITSVKELSQVPAKLMRPKSPKAGKRVILEHIPFIWKKLKFTQKVTVRNLFRYKKRFLMTIIGISGCAALIVAGFGIRDSVSNMIPAQYGKIFKYDFEVSFKENLDKDTIIAQAEQLEQDEKIQNVQLLNINSATVLGENSNVDVSIIIPEDIDEFKNYVELENRKNNDEKYELKDDSIIITEKLSNLLNIKPGDIIKLKDYNDDIIELKVDCITENYLHHYIYMSPELYSHIYNTEPTFNSCWGILEENVTEEDEKALGSKILENKEIYSSITFLSTAKGFFEDIMGNMGLVAVILIVSAGLLAFVVLYNLSNLNISERIRELATIKVLGFYDKEVYKYVTREVVILTIIGIILGLIGGTYLTMFIMKTCELDMLMFNTQMELYSYVIASGITVLFTVVVNWITYFSLKKIDMIESLKSVE